jgi:hypothetical protein
MEASDADDFKTAMLQEVNAHTENDHWEVWKKADVPANQDILPAIWAFKRKRRIDTRAVYKHKARLNIHGGKQKHGVNYWETYSPVVNWFSIRLLSHSDLTARLEDPPARFRPGLPSS